MEPSISLDKAKEIVSTKTHPRVTEESIKDKIDRVNYLRDEHLTIAVIHMKNGFFVLGKSAPADPRNYDKEVGERYAFEDGFKQLWQLEGYLLRDKIAKGEV